MDTSKMKYGEDKLEKMDSDIKTLWQEFKNCSDYMRNVKDMTNIQVQYDMYRMAISRFDEVLNRLDAVETKLKKIEDKYINLDFIEVTNQMISDAHQNSGVSLKNICSRFNVDMSTASRWVNGEMKSDKKARYELYTYLIENASAKL